MYSVTHGVIGTIATLTTYAVTDDLLTSELLGGAIAFALHDPTDRLGETPYPTSKERTLQEGIGFSIFSVCAYFSGLWRLYVIGYIMGNLMDLIDKKFYLAIFFPKKFPATHYFKCHRRKPNIQFSLKQTRLANYISIFVIIIITILIKF